MDSLDPLHEIINSGQGYAQAIIIERILWVVIGLFFIGAISKSIKISLSNKNTYHKKDFNFFNFVKKENENENENSK